MARTRASYDLVAERYAAEIGDELGPKLVDRALLAVVAELAGGGVVADLGCGPGHIAAHLRGLGVRTLAVDLSPAMARIARHRYAVPAAAGDLVALPLTSGCLSAVVCLYAVIHLDPPARSDAYREFARVLGPDGHALIAFHTGDATAEAGDIRHLDEWWDEAVDLDFHFLDPTAEVERLADAGFVMVANVDRAPQPGREHPSRRSYLLVRHA